MPDISTIDGIDILTVANFQGVALTSGSLINGQTANLITDAHILISSQTASFSSSVSFTSGIDSTYDVYEFHFIDMASSISGDYFAFQCNAVGQTGFNEVMTTTYYYAYHYDDDAAAALTYGASDDQSQGTSYQRLGTQVTPSGKTIAGILRLYAPSSTSFAKHFISRSQTPTNGMVSDVYVSGYINTTNAIDQINFKMISGVVSGQIRMYGIKK